MTKFRASHFRLALAAAGALALSATAARAEYLQYKLENAMISSYSINGSGLDDMPAPPRKLAAPSPTPSGPFTIRKEMDISTPLLQQAKPGAPGGKLNSLKLPSGKVK